MRNTDCFFLALLCTGMAGLLTAPAARAENLPKSTNIFGTLGLNTIPSARMDETGTIRAGLSTLDPYAHSWLGFQLADPLSVTIRQSAEISNLNDDADRLYPGVDFKLRLAEENHIRPEISIGVQSAIGHTRMAGEYIAASKRYKNFDFTAGLGWGRYGTAGHFKNPLKAISNHFGKDRTFNSEIPNEPSNWFTGEDVGLFAGVEYFIPWEKLSGLSLKFDYGADRYSAEKAASNFNAPAPWSFGLNYKPASWINTALAIQGTDKIMARLSVQGLLSDWRKQDQGETPSTIMRPHRSANANPTQMSLDASKNDQYLYNIRQDEKAANAHLILQPHTSAPQQIGQAATHMANNAGHTIEKLAITPTVMGLRGPTIHLNRRDLEMARGKNQGSAQEIWHNAEFIPQTDTNTAFTKLKRPSGLGYGPRNLHLSLDNRFSLSEEDSGALYRTSLIAGLKGPSFFGLIDTAGSLRLNIKDNLDKIRNLRPRALLPVRSNEDEFAARRIAIETQYAALTHSFRSDLHLSLLGGYLEEMYGGFGGELLYRPYKARWAIGAESFIAFKRDPDTTLNLGLNGDRLLTGYLQGWYDIPGANITANARVGRYLAEDFGATLALQKTFKNGVELEGFTTITDAADFDLFGGTTHAYHGIRLSMPLGGYQYIPKNTKADFRIAPFGRDTGQSLQNPLPLYDLTEPFSAKHISDYWNEVVE